MSYLRFDQIDFRCGSTLEVSVGLLGSGVSRVIGTGTRGETLTGKVRQASVERRLLGTRGQRDVWTAYK
jgi:hypothetical protein